MFFGIKNFIFIMGLFAIGWLPSYLFATAPLRRHIDARFVVCYALVLLAGFFAPNAPAFFAATLVIWAATVRDRLEAISRYVLLVALVPQVQWPIGIGGSFITILDTTMGLSVLLPVVCLMHRPDRSGEGAPPRATTAEDWVVAVMFLILFFASRPASGTMLLRALVTQGIVVVLPYYVIRRHVRDAQQFRLLVACFGISSILLSIAAIYEVRTNWAIYEGISGRYGDTASILRMSARRGNLMRASATMLNALMMASFMATGWIALACSGRFIRGRTAYYAALAVAFVGLLAPQSRGNLACFALAILLLLLAWRRYGLAAGALIGAGVSAMTLFTLAHTSSTVASFLQLDQQRVAGADYDYRQTLFRRGMQEAMHHPIFGQSLGRAMDNMADLTQGEHIIDMVNTYLTLFLSSGLVGMVPLIALLVITVVNLSAKLPRPRRAALGDLRAFVLASWVVMLAELSFNSMIDRFPYMFAFILAGGHILACERRRRLPTAQGQAAERPVRVFAPPILPTRAVPQPS